MLRAIALLCITSALYAGGEPNQIWWTTEKVKGLKDITRVFDTSLDDTLIWRYDEQKYKTNEHTFLRRFYLDYYEDIIVNVTTIIYPAATRAESNNKSELFIKQKLPFLLKADQESDISYTTEYVLGYYPYEFEVKTYYLKE